MAVQEQTPLQEYTANGIAKQFDLEFDCESADHLIVSIDDLEVLHTDWYLSGNAIMFHVAPADGKQVKIQRNTPFNRLADYQSYNNSFRPPAINKDFDRIWWKLQELGVADWILSNRISALKAYVDDRDDELRAYLLEEIRKQGVALDQLDEYYNYLMERLAQIAVDKGWDASFVVDGNKTQHQINAEQHQINAEQNDKNLLFDKFMLNLVTPEMFGAKANDPAFDNTTALNSAFATGKNIYSTPDKTYYVNGILNSKGQKLIGGWKIHTSRFNLGTVATDVTEPNTSTIKMLYLETAYDLSELLFIKQLGFNIVNHYGYFSAVPADVNGSFNLLLDNAKTAGLMVNVGCENFQAQHDLSDFIQRRSAHPATFGFSVYDEPGARGISIAQQQNKINTIRSLTGKHLSFVDNTGGSDPFNQKTSYDVDILFVDWYSHTQTGTLAERIEKDLQDMRYEYGFFKASSKIDRVIPTVGAFTYDNSLAGPGAYFASDIDQVIGAADVFGRVGKGNFAMFPWDAASDPATVLRVRNSPELQRLAKRLCEQDVRKEYATDAYIFGHKDFDRDWGINSLLKEVAVLDKSTTDSNLNGNAYPISLSYGATETDRTSPNVNSATFYSGIGFKGASAGLATNIKARKNVTAYLNHFNVAAVISGVFTIYGTSDNGYKNNVLASAAIGAGANIRLNAKPTSEYMNLLFHVSSPTDTSTRYRRFVRGLIVTTDW